MVWVGRALEDRPDHPSLWAGVLQLCWCLLCQGTAWGVWCAGEVSCNALLCPLPSF